MTRAHAADTATRDQMRRIAASLPEGELRLEGVATPLPAAAAALVREVIAALASGEPVAVVTTASEMTPNEAAEFLNVSRGSVTKLMDQAMLPFHMVGSHRRIPGAAVAAYKAMQQAKARQAMGELVALSEELGLYADATPPPAKAAFKSRNDASR